MNVRHASKARQLMQGESRVTGQQGIALLTVMLMLLILSILGIASITVTSMENRMAGFFRTTEAVVAAADPHRADGGSFWWHAEYWPRLLCRRQAGI